MAAHDLFVWGPQVAALLPNGVGAVQYAGGVPPTYTIQVTWQESASAPLTYQIVIQVPDL